MASRRRKGKGDVESGAGDQDDNAKSTAWFPMIIFAAILLISAALILPKTHVDHTDTATAATSPASSTAALSQEAIHIPEPPSSPLSLPQPPPTGEKEEEDPVVPYSVKDPLRFGPDVETLTLRSGLKMPAFGYGTCCRSTARGHAVVASTIKYIKAGGRLIDTAMAYRNHQEIGEALSTAEVPRDEIWITSKIAPNSVRSRADTVKAAQNIMKDLGVAYLDLLLIHSPKLGRAKTVELWKGLIDLKRKGLVRAIGVSNMNEGEIADLTAATEEAPEVNQIQFHPWTPKPWRDLAEGQRRENGMVTTAYTSLGGSRFRSSGSHWGPTLAAVAKKHGVKEAQVLLRWAVQQGVAVIPGSASEPHIRENLLQGTKHFVLDEADMDAIDKAPPPDSWFDPKRGPAKLSAKQAELPWGGP
jgi:2,5-diketo-D-gluconate reductase A